MTTNDTNLLSTVTQSEAEALWGDLSTAFTDVETALAKIIKSQAWIPLGYDTFSQAWTDRMKGSKIARSMAASVVYALFDEGLDVDQVRAVIGVGSGLAKDSITVLQTQHSHGVPPSRATTRVRSYFRSPDRAGTAILHVELDEETLKDYFDRAEAVGVDLKKVVKDFLKTWYSMSASRAGKAV